jgi:hypothetical protein
MLLFGLRFFTAAFTGEKQREGRFKQENMLFSAASKFTK